MGWGGKLRDGIFVSGLGNGQSENGQSCQHIHSFTHSFTDLSNTHTHAHTLLTYLPSPGSRVLEIKLLNSVDQKCLSPQSQHSSKI